MVIAVEQLHKHFGARPVLRGLDLRIEAGEIFGLLGPNGAGKTTLIRLLMGLLKPSSGRIRLLDDQPPGALPARRQIGYMPQQLAVYPGLTVWENLLFYGRLYGVLETDLPQQAESLLQMVDLEPQRDQRVGELSGGMIRRVMLATALIHRPRLVLLDEPTAGVDPLLRLRFWDWFETLRRQGTTLLVTTHHIAEAKHCQQVVFLRDGQRLEQGPPEDLIAKYQADDLEQAFVAAIERQRQPEVNA